MKKLKEKSIDLISKAIRIYNPVEIVCAWSGGDDSSVTTHLIMSNLEQFNIPVSVMSANTGMGADGWLDWTTQYATNQGWDHKFYSGDFEGWSNWIEKAGCPRTRSGHKWTFNYLKGRAFDSALKDVKSKYIHLKDHPERHARFNSVLFISGAYRDESQERSKATPITKIGSAVWVNPCIDWLKSDFYQYKHENELPENPFYGTVGGSGDCQCNWGNFITMRKLKKHSPKLANGNAKIVDELSRKNHGYGWDGELEGQLQFFSEYEDHGKLPQMNTPFLCSNCSRSKPKIYEAEQMALLRMESW